MVPRFRLAVTNATQLQALMVVEEAQKSLAWHVNKVMEEFGFEGWVLDCGGLINLQNFKLKNMYVHLLLGHDDENTC